MKRTQAERSGATRDALMRAGRTLFAVQGFAGVSAEAVVREAGVTRGALYHQFEHGKAGLFEAVVVALAREVVEAVAATVGAGAGAAPTDPVDAMRVGMEAWLDECARPEVQRIMLAEAPAVLGWTRWRELGMELGLGMVVALVQAAIDAGRIPSQPARPLAHLLIGALDEAALYVAGAEDPDAARAAMSDALGRILTGLTGPPDAPA